MIRISYPRLHRAVFEVNKKFGLTTKDGRYANRLKANHARDIVERMNSLREEYDVTWYEALVHATAAQKGLGPSRRALYRKAIGLYGWWMRKSMRERGLSYLRVRGKKKLGAEVQITADATGQYQFLTA